MPKMDAPRSFHSFVIQIQASLRAAKGRHVTIAETLEHIQAQYETTDRLIRDAKAGKP